MIWGINFKPLLMGLAWTIATVGGFLGFNSALPEPVGVEPFTFVSSQVGSNVTSGDILTTDGAVSDWVTGASLGLGGDHTFPFDPAPELGGTAVSTSTLIGLFGGFVSTASSTIDNELTVTSTSTFNEHITIGTSTPHQEAQLNIEVDDVNEHGVKITGAASQIEHLLSLEDNGGNELFTIEASGETEIFHTATEDGDHTLHVVTDVGGFGSVSGILVDYDIGTVAGGEESSAILINLDRTNSTGGEVHGVACFATSGSATAECIEANVGIVAIEQHVGTFENMGSCTQSPGLTDILSSCISASTDATLFTNDNDELVIGDAAKFSEIEVVLATDSSKNIVPTFEFSTGADTWTAFSPVDTTVGFQDTGSISWDIDAISAWATGTSTRFYIRIIRTRTANIATLPVEDTLQIASSTEFFWDESANLLINDLIARNSTSTSATTTDLHISSTLFISDDAITDFAGTSLSVDGSGVLNAAGSDHTFPWTASPDIGSAGNATSSPLKFTGGFVSTASSTIDSNLTITGVATTTNVIPSADSTSDLGSASNFWANTYVDKIFLTPDSSIGVVTSKIIKFDIDSSRFQTDTGALRFIIDTDLRRAFPNEDSIYDLGRNDRFFDETFTDELVVTVAGTGATAANEVRLGGQDLTGGDAGLLITTENDTDHLFASDVGIATTTPQHGMVIDTGGLCIDDGTGVCGTHKESAGSATTTGNMRVIGTLDSSDLAFRNLVDNEVIFTFTEGDRVGEDKTDLVLVNMDGENVFIFKQDGTLISKNGIKTTRNYWYLLGLLGLLGLIPRRKT